MFIIAFYHFHHSAGHARIEKAGMDESKRPRLKAAAHAVVSQASRAGGPIDMGEFTMGQARKEIALKLGLGEDGLDEKPWKSEVKNLVQAELVSH